MLNSAFFIIGLGLALFFFVFIMFMLCVIITLEAWHKIKGEPY